MTTHMEGSSDWDLKMKYYGRMSRLANRPELGGAYVYLLLDAASYTWIDTSVAGIEGARQQSEDLPYVLSSALLPRGSSLEST